MIINANGLKTAVVELYDKGMPSGTKAGWKSLDGIYSVSEGQWTLVTGYPGHGKSEWVDALMVNLFRQGWKFVIWSAENLPQQLHVAKLIEKIMGKPFAAGPTERVSKDELEVALDIVSRNFLFIKPSEEGGLSIDLILNACMEAISGSTHDGPWGLVIDPYNELDHHRPSGLSETEYISKSLSKIRAWAREWRVHVFVVAHPAKQLRDKDGKLPRPTPSDVAGSHHWWAKADNAITVWRDTSIETQEVEVMVQKIRFKHIGKPGVATLRYDRITGRYHDIPPRFADDMERAGMVVRRVAA